MSENKSGCLNTFGSKENVAIDVSRILDSCRDKDCIEDLRVYLTRGSQGLLDSCASAKVRCADLLYNYIDVEPVAFDRNHYCIDITFYYRILADSTNGPCRPTTLYGLGVFTKRAVLCGEDSRAHIYRSNTRLGRYDGPSTLFANLPTAIVEVLDPMVLSSKVKETEHCGCEASSAQIPDCIRELFDDPLVLSGGQRQLLVTLGQFSIVRLERDSQLLIPVYDYCMPEKDCSCGSGNCCCNEDPCAIFRNIKFPVGEFFPPNTVRIPDDHEGFRCCK